MVQRFSSEIIVRETNAQFRGRWWLWTLLNDFLLIQLYFLISMHPLLIASLLFLWLTIVRTSDSIKKFFFYTTQTYFNQKFPSTPPPFPYSPSTLITPFFLLHRPTILSPTSPTFSFSTFRHFPYYLPSHVLYFPFSLVVTRTYCPSPHFPHSRLIMSSTFPSIIFHQFSYFSISLYSADSFPFTSFNFPYFPFLD